MMAEYDERPQKRQKLDSFNHENVTRADQIHQWLKFQQSADINVKNGINTFKDYLTAIPRSEDVAYQSRQYQILKEYCQWQKAAAENQVDFYDILSTWSFAVDSNTEAVISAVSAALAQFLKTISGILELRIYGVALIDSLLRRDQSKLFEKCLQSPRTKPHLASPCLRLLTEMVSFDAGARSADFWFRRDLIVPKFEAVLEVQSSSDDPEERKKPSVRRMALRFLIALLRYLDAPAKKDLLFQARALHKCLGGLMQDADDIIVGVLKAMNQYLLDDEKISRTTLARFFNAIHLEALATLYTFDHGDNEIVRAAAHKLLIKICTSEKRIFGGHSNWSSSPETSITSSDDDFIDLGLDSPFISEASKIVSTQNTALATFIQKIQPQQDSLQASLLVGIFQANLDLLPEYFSRKRHAPVAASDDSVWRNYFAFIFAVVEIHIPVYSERSPPSRPPHLQVVAECILPSSIDRTYLAKMLSSQDQILRISAARLVSIVLMKLRDVLSTFNRLSITDTHLWRQAQNHLSEIIELRLPAVREVNLAVQHNLKNQDCSALLECLQAFHQVLPDAAIATAFDIGPVIVELCLQLEQRPDEIETYIERLAYCTNIASKTSIKWLHRADNDSLSPLITLIKATTSAQHIPKSRDLLLSLRRVLYDRGIISFSNSVFAALYTSLTPSRKFAVENEILLFIDNCISRVAQKPVKYLDNVEQASQVVSDRKPLSLLVAAVAEQWSYALKKHEDDKAAIKGISAWIARIFTLLDAAGENYRVILHFQEAMLRNADAKTRGYFQDALDKLRKKPLSVDEAWLPDISQSKTSPLETSNEVHTRSNLFEIEQLAHEQMPIPDGFQGLDRWSNELEIELEINTKRLQRLVLCLASVDAEIRLQAYQNLQKVLHIIDTASNYEGKQQIFLIMGELCETVNHYGAGSQPLPTIIPELSNTLLEIAIQPTHFLFSKANKFLLHKPFWSPIGIITYWIEHLLQQPPDGDESDTWNQEKEWLLRLLVCGLREEIDLQLYRRCALWEHVLSLYSSVCISPMNKKLILALIWKAINMPGGADILWTRFGVHSWLSVVESDQRPAPRDLRLQMEQKCTASDIEDWKASTSLAKLKVSR